ncbi:hypothetical protein LCGC14_1640280, partial [marine sediment metagenome]
YCTNCGKKNPYFKSWREANLISPKTKKGVKKVK